MTDAEWAAATDPILMLVAADGRVSGRKARLFACACVRRHARVSNQYGCAGALRTAERMCDGEATEEEYAAAVAAIEGGEAEASNAWSYLVAAVAATLRPDGMEAATLAVDNIGSFSWELFDKFDEADCAGVLRDILGDPFHPPVLDCFLLTSDVVALARGIYNDLAFDRLPLLADALLDAGCPDNELVAHCRSPGPHHKGCWIIDLILGKE